MKALVYWMVALMVGLGACTSDVDKDKDDDDDEIAEWDELVVTLEVSRPTTAKFNFTSEAREEYDPKNHIYPTPKVDFPMELEINWGDGQTTNSDSHDYQDAGTYLVKIKGKGIGTFNFKPVFGSNYKYADIEKLSVKNWPNLKYLRYCTYDLDFTKCPKLEHVNYLVPEGTIALNFSECPKLKYLTLRQSHTGNSTIISNLNVTGCEGLRVLVCNQLKLTKLDVSSCTKLEVLECSINQITQLDVSKNTELFSLKIYDNQLTSLDVSKNTELTDLLVDYNQLTSLDVSKNTKLTNLYIGYNQLTSLDVSKNTELTSLRVSWNQLNHSALNQIYNALPYADGFIYIENNPATGDTYIATQKGWEVIIKDF